MRRVIIALAATIAGLIASATPSNAAPSATLTSPTADDGLVQKVQIFPRRYYRQYPYGVHFRGQLASIGPPGGDPPAQRRSHILEVRTPRAGAPERLRVASMMDLRMALAGQRPKVIALEAMIRNPAR